MTLASISNLSVQQILTSQLQAEQTNLATLDEQLASNQQHNNLTDYAPSDALKLMNLQNGVTNRQSYIAAMNTVQSRLSVYDTSLTDIESIVSQAQSLAAGNPSYDPTKTGSMAGLVDSFMRGATVDLNQQVGGRYIFAGSRYTTPPVTDLTNLSVPPASGNTVPSPALPVYDTQYTAQSLTMSTAGQQVTIGGTPAAGQAATITVNNKTYSYTVQSGDTTTAIATALTALVAADVSGTTSTGAVITVGGSGTINSTSVNPTSAAAYAKDSINIDTNNNQQYGIVSTDPAFQQMVTGLQYLKAATQATDAATYQTDINKANTLLATALSGIQTVHAGLADTTNVLSNEKITQNNNITNLQNQISNIQQVDITQVSTEINLLQTQLQASYSATASIEQMSIVKYL